MGQYKTFTQIKLNSQGIETSNMDMDPNPKPKYWIKENKIQTEKIREGKQII